MCVTLSPRWKMANGSSRLRLHSCPFRDEEVFLFGALQPQTPRGSDWLSFLPRCPRGGEGKEVEEEEEEGAIGPVTVVWQSEGQRGGPRAPPQEGCAGPGMCLSGKQGVWTTVGCELPALPY